jgi:hypothetical protein
MAIEERHRIEINGGIVWDAPATDRRARQEYDIFKSVADKGARVELKRKSPAGQYTTVVSSAAPSLTA